MGSEPFEILLYYKFVAVDDPEALARDQLDLGTALGLKGRILVAHEGLNGTVSGTKESCRAYREAVWSDPRFADTVFKIDPSQGHAFRRLSVKPRKEIVTLGTELDKPVYDQTGSRLTPKQFREKMGEPGVVVVDGRNAYEYDLGHFEGAIRPPLETFRETPNWFRELGVSKDAAILTYCTGGVRCEKLTSLLIQEGYRDVYQLDGGIVTYGRDAETKGSGFVGRCFVFDDRISVEIDQTPGRPVIAKCRFCQVPSETYVNCANVDCNALYFCCATCEDRTERCCQPTCASSVRRREKRGRLQRTGK